VGKLAGKTAGKNWQEKLQRGGQGRGRIGAADNGYGQLNWEKRSKGTGRTTHTRIQLQTNKGRLDHDGEMEMAMDEGQTTANNGYAEGVGAPGEKETDRRIPAGHE